MCWRRNTRLRFAFGHGPRYFHRWCIYASESSGESNSLRSNCCSEQRLKKRSSYLNHRHFNRNDCDGGANRAFVYSGMCPRILYVYEIYTFRKFPPPRYLPISAPSDVQLNARVYTRVSAATPIDDTTTSRSSFKETVKRNA